VAAQPGGAVMPRTCQRSWGFGLDGVGDPAQDADASEEFAARLKQLAEVVSRIFDELANRLLDAVEVIERVIERLGRLVPRMCAGYGGDA
jgi:hypothetical protein